MKIIQIVFIKKNNPILNELPKHELLTIVVNPSNQGHGYAKDLFVSLCNHYKKRNVKNFKIVVRVDLLRAHAFYLKMGCDAAGEVEVHKGKSSTVYIKSCS